MKLFLILVPMMLFWAWFFYGRKKHSLSNRIEPESGSVSQQFEPFVLPRTIKGRSFISGGNDLYLYNEGFAFTSVGSKNDIIYWSDVASFSVSTFRQKQVIVWHQTSAFRDMSAEEALSKKIGTPQMVRSDEFELSSEFICQLMNQLWLKNRERPI